jgi:hypothetical protein
VTLPLEHLTFKPFIASFFFIVRWPMPIIKGERNDDTK